MLYILLQLPVHRHFSYQFKLICLYTNMSRVLAIGIIGRPRNCAGWFGKTIKCTKSWATFIKNSRVKTSMSILIHSILFRLILRHLQHLDINCYRSKWKRMKCTKLKVKCLFMMMIEHCFEKSALGKIKMTWWMVMF